MKKILFIILCLFVLPLSVFAGSQVECSTINDGSVLNNWQRYNLTDYDVLAGGFVNYCRNQDQSDSGLNSGGDIYELVYDSNKNGKYRLYCLNHGLNAPTNSTLTKVSTTWDKGPACAFYKYNDSGVNARHNRIRYIQNKCTVSCNGANGDDSSTCCSTEQCTDNFISDDCVGYRKSEPSDSGNDISIDNITEYSSSGNYFVIEASVSMSGKVSSYNASISPSIPGAFVTDSVSGTNSVTNTSASTLYIKVPKSSVTTSMSSNLKIVADYEISCTYKRFGLTYYMPTKGGVRIANEQRVAFRTIDEVTPTENKSKEDTAMFSLTPEESGNDYLIVSKIDDDTGDQLPGAVFGLYKDSSCSSSVGDSNGNTTVTTDGNGTGYFFVPADSGDYYIKEISAPSGYTPSSSCTKALINNTLVVENRKIPEEVFGKIIINKKDMASSQGIEGVKFELFTANQDIDSIEIEEKEDFLKALEELISKVLISATDKDGNTIGALTTDADGKIEIPNLKYGTYYLAEISAPDKYIMSDELIEVVVDKEVVDVDVENALRNITIIKIDSVTKEAITGGKYRIVDEEGNSVAEFTMDNGTYLLDIAAGKYTFIEIIPPKGYVDANVAFDFEVSEEGNVVITSSDDRHYYLSENMAITVVNDKEEVVPDVPKTGVLNNRIIIGIGTLLIIGGVGSIIIIKRKNS